MEYWVTNTGIFQCALYNTPSLQYSNTPVWLPCAQLVHRFDHGDDMFHRGLGQNTMAQIENMTGPGAGAAQDFSDAVFDFFRRCIERDWIEISLDGDIIADGLPGFVKINAPVEPDHRSAGGANVLQ